MEEEKERGVGEGEEEGKREEGRKGKEGGESGRGGSGEGGRVGNGNRKGERKEGGRKGEEGGGKGRDSNLLLTVFEAMQSFQMHFSDVFLSLPFFSSATVSNIIPKHNLQTCSA